MQIIDEQRIIAALDANQNPSRQDCLALIEKARSLKGLRVEEAAALLQTSDAGVLRELFAAAREVKEAIYGTRLVLFAPLYLTNFCVNNCLYCGFRRDNRELFRSALAIDEIGREVEALLGEGHKRLLLVAGEDPRTSNISYLEMAIEAVYAARQGKSSIRRVNINVAPMPLEHFRRLKATKIGTYQLFQETYHYETYQKMHPDGPKSDYAARLAAMDNAQQAGIDDVGIGALFGLYDYRFEVLALLMHAEYLEGKYGTGPHTISVPRLESASGAPLSENPPYPVSDEDFKKLVAIIRLSVPYTGMILSTRETAELRNETFRLGISQISAGSLTSPGAYAKRGKEQEQSLSKGSKVELDENKRPSSQFSVHDKRSTAEVVRDVCSMGFVPSFCTACYRSGRTGDYFMQFAKTGKIQNFCLPNALLTFKEYLVDYADGEMRALGDKAIEREIVKVKDDKIRAKTRQRLQEIEKGARDLFF